MEGNGGNDWKPCKSRPIPNRFFDWLFNSYLHYINYVVRLHLFFGEHLPDGRSEGGDVAEFGDPNSYTSRSSPVTASILSDLPGHIPGAVTVPGGIPVRPASVISDAVILAASAFIFSSYISGMSPAARSSSIYHPSMPCECSNLLALPRIPQHATCTASFPREEFQIRPDDDDDDDALFVLLAYWAVTASCAGDRVVSNFMRDEF